MIEIKKKEDYDIEECVSNNNTTYFKFKEDYTKNFAKEILELETNTPLRDMLTQMNAITIQKVMNKEIDANVGIELSSFISKLERSIFASIKETKKKVK